MLLDSQILKTDVDHTQAARDSFARILAALGRRPVSEESPETPLRGRAAAPPYPEKDGMSGVGGVKSEFPPEHAVTKDKSGICGVAEKGSLSGSLSGSFSAEDDEIRDELAVELNKVTYCGETVIKYQCPACSTVAFRPIQCGKWWCEECGNTYAETEKVVAGEVRPGFNLLRMGSIHAERIRDYKRRVDTTKMSAHSFVFTVTPAQRREIVADPAKYEQCVQSLHDIFVGNHRNGKHSKRGEYEGKHVMEMPHPAGNRAREGFKLHFNVEVWFNRYVWRRVKGRSGRIKVEARWSVPKTKLQRIKRRWQKACEQIFTARARAVNVNVWNWLTTQACNNGIEYVTRPPDPQLLRFLTDSERRFLVLDIKGKQHIRYWGLASNSHQAAWQGRKTEVKKHIECPNCRATMEVCVGLDRQGRLRPVVLTRERLELELEQCGWTLIRYPHIWEAVRPLSPLETEGGPA